MPAVVSVTSNEAVCCFCHIALDSLCLKCQKCKGQIHLNCTGLPEYHLVRLVVTSASYVCMHCVETHETDQETYKMELERINMCKQREKRLCEANNLTDSIDDAMRDMAISDVNRAIPPADSIGSTNAATSGGNQDGNLINNNQNLNSSNNSSGLPTQPERTDGVPENEANKSNQAVCRFYLKKACKYGRKGENCPFNHPKLCYKYIKRGEKSGGCKKGKDCQFLHPQLCKRALNTRTCLNKNCRYYHVQGTKLTNETTSPGQSPEQSNNVPIQINSEHRQYSEIVKQGNARRYQRIAPSPISLAENVSCVDANKIDLNRQDFLEMKFQMKSLQDQLQMLISFSKPHLSQLQPPSTQMNGWLPRA